MFRSSITALFLLLATAALSAQNVKVEEPENIARVMERFVEFNKSKQFVDGWRVQILATPDRQRLENARQSFQERYPNVSSDWVHSKPYYKLRAGAFATKLEALRLLYILKEDYPAAYLVRDNQVKPEELVFNY